MDTIKQQQQKSSSLVHWKHNHQYLHWSLMKQYQPISRSFSLQQVLQELRLLLNKLLINISWITNKQVAWTFHSHTTFKFPITANSCFSQGPLHELQPVSVSPDSLLILRFIPTSPVHISPSLFSSFADTLLLQLAAVDPSPLNFTHIPQFLQPGAIPSALVCA